MAKEIYIGVDGVAKKAKAVYIGVEGVARKLKAGYVGDENGIARQFFDGVRMVTITLAGTGYSTYAACTIDGTTYYTGQEEVIEVPAGTVINLSVKDKTSKEDYAQIQLYNNGAYSSDLVSGPGSCDYTVNGNVTINFSYGSELDYMSYVYYGTIKVYEE